MKPGSADQQSSEAKELVVFDIVRDSKCADCGKELLGGDFLFMEAERPLCLTCADLDHLTYLPRGDTALTRRARKHSTLSAVVVRFSRLASAMNGRECGSKNLRWSRLRQSARLMPSCAVYGASERRSIATNRIRFSQCKWRNRFGRCFQAARRRRRGRLPRIRRFGAAAEWVGPPPDEHSKKKHYAPRWWQPFVTGIRNTIAC